MMAKRKLIFLGGGDFCRELLWTAEAIPRDKRDWEPTGILDDNVDNARQHLQNRGVRLPVLGAIDSHQPTADEVFISAIGNTVYKLKSAEQMESRGAQFINLIHPSALIAPDAHLGTGIFVFMNSVVSAGARLEDFVTVNAFVLVGHDAVIGRGCNLNPASMVMGNVKLGRGVLMAAHTSVSPGNEVGDFATVGAGSAVFSAVPAGVTVLGVPARVISPSRDRAAAARSST
jgi:sugar O-acyltransferase (sialic acid O-acetyltransferase NeuD family)